jgi:hypothetical protein
MMVGMEFGDKDMGEILPGVQNARRKPVSVTQQKGGTYENSIVMTIDQCRIAVETIVAVEEDLHFQVVCQTTLDGYLVAFDIGEIFPKTNPGCASIALHHVSTSRTGQFAVGPSTQ